jgi:membrane-associated phospholipid phosphatase
MKSGTSRVAILLLSLLLAQQPIEGQDNRLSAKLSDSLPVLTGKSLILPALLIGYGFAQFSIDGIRDLDVKVREKVVNASFTHCHLDDYLQFAPAAAVYGLNLAGVQGRHNFAERTIILGTSLAIMTATVHGIKYMSRIQRPDHTSFNAFPSGHTATAFACADFLFHEYRDVSVWYGVAGYAVATATGFLRIYNNRHWLTDVVAGAGFGILSNQIALWMFPKVRHWVNNSLHMNISVVPFVSVTNQPGMIPFIEKY